MPCPRKYKVFFCYLRVSTKEGLLLDTNITDEDVRFDEYDKDVYRNCRKCRQTFEIKLAFKDVITPELILYYSDNQLYRICTNLYRSSAEALFRSENIKDKQGTLSKETIYKFLNSKTS